MGHYTRFLLSVQLGGRALLPSSLCGITNRPSGRLLNRIGEMVQKTHHKRSESATEACERVQDQKNGVEHEPATDRLAERELAHAPVSGRPVLNLGRWVYSLVPYLAAVCVMAPASLY